MTPFRSIIASRYLLLVSVCVASGAGCDTRHGSGIAGEETRSHPPFTAVEVSAGLEVHVSPGPPEVTLRGDDNLLREVSTEVVDGVLVIRPLRDLDPVLPLVVEVRAPRIDRLGLRAGGRLVATGLEASTLEVSLEAGGDVEVAGATDTLTARLSGGGTLDAAALVSGGATVHGEGGGEIRITATRSVAGLITSGTRAVVYGQPEARDVATSAGGRVDFR